jgi:hypothetical protein
MLRQPATNKAHAQIHGWPQPRRRAVPAAAPATEDVAPAPRLRPSRPHYTPAGDRSTAERDYAETRLFKRIGGLAIFACLVAFAIQHAH